MANLAAFTGANGGWHVQEVLALNSGTTKFQSTQTATNASYNPASGSAPGRKDLILQNLGPNDVYIAPTSAACVLNKCLRIPANGGVLNTGWGENMPFWVKAASADQVTGAALIVVESW